MNRERKREEGRGAKKEEESNAFTNLESQLNTSKSIIVRPRQSEKGYSIRNCHPITFKDYGVESGTTKSTQKHDLRLIDSVPVRSKDWTFR